jgi:hypothetical protein
MPVRSPSSRRRSACSALSLLLAAGLSSALRPYTLDGVLAAAAEYVEQYDAHLTALIAEERYEQSLSGPRMRPTKSRLESDFLFLRLPSTNEWLGFRDVHTVNGRRVRTRDDRLAGLLIDPIADVGERARAIVSESSRYNLGRPDHTVNVPMLVLDWVTLPIRARLAFSKYGEERIRGIRTWRLAFRETTKPTLIRTPAGEDIPSEGFFWIEPASGRIVETELVSHGQYEMNGVPTRVVSTVRVQYQHDRRLDVFVPVEMRETLEVSPNKVIGVAVYRNFRRFETTVRIK